MSALPDRRGRVMLLLAVGLLVLAGCGGSDDSGGKAAVS
ncbi:MAG: hypothetical protein QOJ85_499, partial [Solirubrobacteraceae bacterium]|nr:hypothetical protein [Solirubrobacteraceae bacterium]